MNNSEAKRIFQQYDKILGERLTNMGYVGRGITPEIVTDKNATIRTFMHYSDTNAHRVLTVFGKESPNLFYNYSDRLECTEKWRKAAKVVDAMGVERETAAWFEAVLTIFHDSSKLDLRHIQVGVNKGNGNSYLIFGYTYS